MDSSTLRLENGGGKWRPGMPRLGLADGDVVVMEKKCKQTNLHSRRRRKGGKKDDTGLGSVVYASNCGRSNKEDTNDCGSNTSSFLFSSGSGSGSGSLFSTSVSASCSAERSSFGSYHDSLFPNLLHLEGRGRCGSGGQDPDPERRRASFDLSINTSTTTTQRYSREADQEIKGSGGEEEDDRIELPVLDPAKHFFSLALRECQNRRYKSEGISLLAVAKRQQKRRPASVDFNSPMSDTSVSSPRSLFAVVGSKKTSAMSAVHNRSGMFPSPGTPNYRHGGAASSGYQKGWSSERVPLPSNAGRKFGSSAALLPLGTGGKALPSKWEDAEKWICSPVSSEGFGIRQSAVPPHHRRPKSKSGPLGTQGVIGGCYSLGTSPSVPGFDGGRIPNFMANSPFMAGVLMAGRGRRADDNANRSEADGVCGIGVGRSNSAQSDHSMVRSASVHGWSDLLMESSSSLPSSQDEKLESSKDGGTTVSSVILTKDVATQMSPDGSTHSSSKDCPKSSSSSSPPPRTSRTIGELRNHIPKLEVRDVQIDDRVTVTRWSKKHVARGLDKSSTNIIQCKKRTPEARSSGWEVTDTVKCTSRSTREEAKITAWENLQKAQAEAAIRKLEMKIEKTRSSSMDKILNKLRSAQSKAQEMRNAANAKRNHQVSTTTAKMASIFHKARRIASFGGCFSSRSF